MSNTNFVRYDAYKDSGVEWLGGVPATWDLNRHKDIFYFISDRCANSLLTKVGLENIEGKTGHFIVTDTEFDGGGIEFKKNDILFGKLRPYLSKVYLAEFNGSAVGDIFVYRPKRSITSIFAQYLMLSDRYIDVINSSTSGAKMPRVSSNFIANLPIATPRIEEQTTIAAYLDTKTAHIDRKIDLLSQKAAQYGTLKQSLINETVTRGLDKTVAMKDSGVDWIGEVPAHWEVKRLKESVRLFHGYSFSEQDFSKNISDNFLVKITELQDNKVSLKKNSAMLKNNPAFEKYRIKKNEMLIALSGATAGKISIFDLDDKCYLNQRVAKIKGSKNYNYKFLFYFLNRQQIVDIMYALSNITAQPNFNNNILFINCLTPPFSEQQAISDYLDEKTAHIDRIVETINTQIEKLKELRKTLINDVVTGKIKVE